MVVVVGCFVNYKVKDLHQVNCKLNQTSYHIISFGMQLEGQEFVLMQDNDPKHTSKLSQRYIKSKEEQHILQLMPWRAQSVDLNPI